MSAEDDIPDLASDDPELLRRLNVACGRTIRTWALLEILLVEYLQLALGVDKFRARVVWLSLPNFSSRRLLLLNLSKTYCSQEAHSKFEKLLKRCSRLASQRNKLAHALSGVDAESGKVFFMSDQKHSDIGTDFMNQELITLNNIEGWPDAIHEIRKDLLEWRDTFGRSVQASPRQNWPSEDT